MAEVSNAGRRWIGAIFLAIALVMLVLGQTVLRSHLNNFDFIIYWVICAAFTMSAASVALVDMVALRRRLRREQRELIEHAIEDIGRDQQRHRDEKKKRQ